MDYDRGLVLYDLDGTVRRTGLSRATVKRHVAVLRELGALVWVRCGSKRNLRLPGRAYTATATIYGAVIPPGFDQAMGHRLAGHGYEARVCGVTEAGRERAVAAARTAVEPVDKRAVDNRSSASREPHSLGGSPPVGQAEVVGGGKDTSHARRPTTSPAPKRMTRRGPRRSARQVAQDIGIARQVRPLVSWAQRESLRRLAYALRPLIDRGLDSLQIAAELQGMCMGWRPAKPAAYIRAALVRGAQHDADLFAGYAAAPADTVPQGGPKHPEWAWALEEVSRQAAEELELVAEVAEGELGGADLLAPADLAELRQAAEADIGMVLAAVSAGGQEYALRLYGPALVRRARASRSSTMALNSTWQQA